MLETPLKAVVTPSVIRWSQRLGVPEQLCVEILDWAAERVVDAINQGIPVFAAMQAFLAGYLIACRCSNVSEARIRELLVNGPAAMDDACAEAAELITPPDPELH